MGLIYSKPKTKTPYEVLGIPPLSTKEEVRASFLLLVKKRDPSSLQEIVTAYDTLSRQPPDLSLYTEEVLKEEKYAVDLFLRIGEWTGVGCPPFGTPSFYKQFVNFNCPRKFKREEERILFNYQVRKAIKIVKGMIGDVKGEKMGEKKEMSVNKEIGVKNEIGVNKEITVKEFKCVSCTKGFRSTNQLINHLKSKKHFLRVEKEVENPKEFIKRQIEEINRGEGSDSVVRDSKEKSDIEECVSPSLLPKGFKREPIVFRTCSKCKREFESRVEMVRHIKEEH